MYNGSIAHNGTDAGDTGRYNIANLRIIPGCEKEDEIENVRVPGVTVMEQKEHNDSEFLFIESFDENHKKIIIFAFVYREETYPKTEGNFVLHIQDFEIWKISRRD